MHRMGWGWHGNVGTPALTQFRVSSGSPALHVVIYVALRKLLGQMTNAPSFDHLNYSYPKTSFSFLDDIIQYPKF